MIFLFIFLFIFFIFYVYKSILLSVVLSLLCSYLMVPIIQYLTDRWRIPRLSAITMILFVFSFVFIFFSLKIIPILYDQIISLFSIVPGSLKNLYIHWLPIINQTLRKMPFLADTEWGAYFQEFDILPNLGSKLQQTIVEIWTNLSHILKKAVHLILVPLLTFLFLNNYHKIISFSRKQIPKTWLLPLSQLAGNFNRTLRAIIKGQLTVAFILCVLYSIGLSIVQLQFSLAIGFVAGICRVIPYLDVFVGGFLSLFVLVANKAAWNSYLLVALVFAFIQLIDGLLITPKIVGERVGINPIVAVCSVVALSDSLGLWGILLAIPLVALIKETTLFLIPYYHQSQFYKGHK